MMAQYRRIKGGLPGDALLLFRLGDFYEMFFEDAKTGAQILNLALTARNGIPMCGLPFHAAAGYISRILRSGRKVALCEQTEDPRPGKLVNREVTQILSPGTHFDERLLVAERNNFLAAIHPASKSYGLALVDLTTGDFLTTELDGDAALLGELERVKPAEIMVPSGEASLVALVRDGHPLPGEYEAWTFAPETAGFTLREHFKVASLDGFGLKDRPAAVGAAGAALHYLIHHLRRDVKQLTRIGFYQRHDYLTLDSTTLRHLEILEAQREGTSLFDAMNHTATPMGARRLRQWLSQPLAEVQAIRRRQEAVGMFLANAHGLEGLRGWMREIRDLERTLGRLSSGSGNARDLCVLRQALDQLPNLKAVLARVATPLEEPQKQFPGVEEPASVRENPSLLNELDRQIEGQPELVDLIGRAIVDEPPLALKEGGMIRDGFDPALDELRAAQRGGKDWVARLQAEEIERTGIASLKVRFNSVFGYYIEVTKSNLDKVPATYIRKQTVANGERFITPELKEMEGKILGAEERSTKLEYELFQRLREEVLMRLPAMQAAAAALAQLDVLAAFAETARLHQYCRPDVRNEGTLILRDARHPVLEQRLVEERFVPNDTEFDRDRQIMLITGPNMAGKSTYIRQVALLALLAHTGSFVPATQARIDLLDRIFTRIGASDDLSRGQSTFMVEMSETANILNNATARSLIVLDEIGRGTSTFDGLSLAWAIVEHLHHQTGAKTLFATHYHELTELAVKLARLKNYNVAVREWQDQIVFLRKIVPGGTDKSYGIQVARLAGVPKPVLERAKEILVNLEESELTPEGQVRTPRRHQDREKLKKLVPPPQLDLFRHMNPVHGPEESPGIESNVIPSSPAFLQDVSSGRLNPSPEVAPDL